MIEVLHKSLGYFLPKNNSSANQNLRGPMWWRPDLIHVHGLIRLLKLKVAVESQTDCGGSDRKALGNGPICSTDFFAWLNAFFGEKPFSIYVIFFVRACPTLLIITSKTSIRAWTVSPLIAIGFEMVSEQLSTLHLGLVCLPRFLFWLLHFPLLAVWKPRHNEFRKNSFSISGVREQKAKVKGEELFPSHFHFS